MTHVLRHRETIFDPAVVAHNGRIVKLIGDGVIAEFGSVADAVNCARCAVGQSPSSSQPVTLEETDGPRLGKVLPVWRAHPIAGRKSSACQAVR